VLFLDDALERPGAVRRVIAGPDQVRPGGVGQFQRDLPLRQPLSQAAELDFDDLLQLGLVQGVEDDHLVDPVEKLRPEVSPHLLQHRVAEFLLLLLVAAPVSRATACRSWYSAMSMRTIARSSSKSVSANARASSVLPTPVGPRNRNDPIGRFGSFSPERARTTASATAWTASSCPISR